MASENDSTPLESGDKSDLSQPNSNTAADAQEQPSLESADGMDMSFTPALQNSSQSSLQNSAVPSDAGAPGLETGDTNGAAPYGTRSKNRTVANRPNYAEDKEQEKELDNLIEANGKITRSAPAKAAPPTAVDLAAAEVERNSSNATRRGFAAVNTNVPELNGSASAARDLIPGTSTFSANPSVNGNGPVPQSKKRKQPGANTTVSASSAANNTAPRMPRSSVSARQHHETNMMTFEGCGARLTRNKELIADDGTILSVNDHAYFICEPPGEPYYLARIMEFLPISSEEGAPIDSVRVNWYYRPKDIQRKVQDTRVVFASMHSDTCPLTSLRGKCNIQHLSEIPNLDEYRVKKDSFWFDKLFDRYIHRYYEVIPTDKVVNVPLHVKKVLDERWKFVLVEIGRGKELTSAVKTCKKCSSYAASHDSVDCAVCKNTYHMACIRPPLLKKPARGFAWACAACSRAQELRLEARHTPNLTDAATHGEDEAMEEEEDDAMVRDSGSRASSAAPESTLHPSATAEQIAQANLWPYRYLGVHCRVEDALDYDDRIYPRASSRLGPRHQANVNVWHGRPVELVKPSEIKKKYIKSASHKKDGKLSRETIALLEADKESKLKRPKWVMDEPFGYIPRGEDEPVEIKGKKEHTAHLTFKMPDEHRFTARGGDDTTSVPDNREKLVDDYMQRVKRIAPQYNLPDFSTNFLTKAIERLQDNDYDVEKALAAMKTLHLRLDLKEPDLNKEEVKKFEEGILKYGNELHNVARHVGAIVKEARIVRYYYMWKKTERGRQLWGSYEGRRSKKENKKAEENKQRDGNAVKLLDDVADDQDDSAFDNDKAAERKRGFECKFCNTRHSRQWRRAPGTAPGTLVPRDSSSKNSKDKSSWLTVALCGKCAYLWRRYAIQFESIEEVSRKIAAAGGRASKRRIDEELMRTIVEAQEESGDTISSTTAAVAASAGVEVPSTIIQTQEPPKKKAKSDKDAQTATPEVVPEKKKPVPEKPAEPAPLKPEPPRVKILPCAVCLVVDAPDDELLNCRDCRLAVHKSCYGINPELNTKKWFCDMCSNDRSTMVSTTYECVLCPVTYTEHELMEPPKVSHKKKTDREREKERKEKEMVEEAVRLYRQQQEAAGRPANPREALKRTAWNNWIHVTCAIWTPEIKFGMAETLEPAEGVGFIPADRFEAPCKICKRTRYPTVKCHAANCNVRFHVGCAHQELYHFGLDIGATPKGTRRDVVTTMKLGEENGVATAAIFCRTHETQQLHHILEPTEEGLTALQLYARTFKQVDKSITGTVRRAAQFTQVPQAAVPAAPPGSRRASTMNGIHTGSSTNGPKPPIRSNRASPAVSPSRSADELHTEPEPIDHRPDIDRASKKCYNCRTEFSPKWWPIERPQKSHKQNTGPVYSLQSVSNGIGPDEPSNSQANNPPGIPTPVYGSISSASPLQDPNVSPITAKPPLSNGVVKTEPTSQAVAEIRAEDSSEQTLWQCHKCHVEKRSPPPVSPPYHSQRLWRPSEPVMEKQLFYQASFPQPYYGQAHSHPPPAPPPPGPHSGSVPWHSGRPPPVQPPQSSGWRMETDHARNGIPPPISNGMPQAPMYHHPAPPPPPPPPPPPTGCYQPHPAHAHGPPQPYPPSNSIHAPYSPHRYSQPPPHHPYASSPPPLDMRNGVMTSPQLSGPQRSFPPPPPDRSINHSRNQSKESARPATPAEAERPGSSRDATGASASPNVKNLIHNQSQ